MSFFYSLIVLFISLIPVLVTSSSAPPKLNELIPKEQFKQLGQKFLLTCYLLEEQSILKPYSFEWFHNGFPVNQQQQQQQQQQDQDHSLKIHTENDVSILTIDNINIEHNGNYTCLVRNQFGFDQQNIILVVKAPQLLSSFRERIDQELGNKFRLTCSIQKGTQPFKFEWLKNDLKISSSPSLDYDNDHRLNIEYGDDYTNLIIKRLILIDSANYTCRVYNNDGFDQQIVFLNVQVPPSWIIEPKDVHTNGKEGFKLECKADGSPKPNIKWITSKGITIESEYLDVQKYRTNTNSVNIDTYECIADNGVGEPLRKTIKVSFMVPVKFQEKFTAHKIKRGESARLECNATGDQPLSIQWTKNNVKLDKLGSNYEIIDTTNDNGIHSELFMQTTQTNDAAIYKCFAENEHGKDERTIRLEVVEVPDAPKNVHVKEVWSRTVSLTWNEPFNGNLPILKYTIQYWRYQSAPHRLYEVIVPGSQNSFFLKDLNPGQSYELSIMAENEIGKGSTSTPVTFTTGEEEPSAPPNDITVETMGPSTIRVTWRSPPIENWNGIIKGYYVGYRNARETGSPSSPFVYITVPITTSSSISTASASAVATSSQQKIRPTSSVVSQHQKEINFHEYFLRQLSKGTEYILVVKAFNSAGSGPQSHELMARTFDAMELPPQFQLNIIDSTEETISMQWYQKFQQHQQQSSAPITSYTIHYRKEHEHKWKEVPISANNNPSATGTTGTGTGGGGGGADNMNSFNSYSFVLENLEPNVHYLIYVAAINRFGIGDPSNICLARTQNGMSIITHEVMRRSYDGYPYYLEPLFIWPLMIATVIIIIVLIVAYVCIRKTRNSSENPFNLDAATLNKRLSAAYSAGTTPRYADFEKQQTTNKTTLMINDGGGGGGGQANVYPTPYATLPMGAVVETPWERPLPNPNTLKNGPHIYDHPQ